MAAVANGARVTPHRIGAAGSRRKLTLFDQEYVERLGREVTRKQFTLTFRTLTVHEMASRLEEAGLEVEALLGDYQGAPWDIRAEAWIILARRPVRERRKATPPRPSAQGRKRKRIG